MKNKKGNVAMIAIVVVIVAITTGVFGWMVAKNTQTPASQKVKTQPTAPVAQTKPAEQSVVQTTDSNKQEKTTYNDIEWQLISGKDGDACTGLVYSGSKTVKSWYVWDMGYVEKEWVLQITDSDIDKFPKLSFGVKANAHSINQKLKLIDASSELKKELKAATKNNPKEITLKGYYLYCEGAPVVSIAPATESFKQYIKK